jgi:hypothetical protein
MGEMFLIKAVLLSFGQGIEEVGKAAVGRGVQSLFP